MTRMIPMAELCRKVGGDLEPIDPSTAYKWIKQGWLPRPRKVGRLSRWREEEVDAALEHLSERSTKAAKKPKGKLRWSLTPAKGPTPKQPSDLNHMRLLRRCRYC